MVRLDHFRKYALICLAASASIIPVTVGFAEDNTIDLVPDETVNGTLHKYTKAIYILWLVLLFPVGAHAFTCNSGRLHIEIEQGIMTLQAKDVKVRDLFQELEKKSGIAIKYFGDKDDMMSADIRDCPLQTGIDIVTKNFNHSAVYTGFEKGDDLVISSLFIYSREGDSPLNYVHNSESNENSNRNVQKQPRVHNGLGGVAHQVLPPLDSDPLLSMRALDPLTLQY